MVKQTAPFVSQCKGVDGNKKINGRKWHIITDALGLVWGVMVPADHQADGVMAHKMVVPFQGYMHQMKKILADAAYEKAFMQWVEENLLGVDLEISSKPPLHKNLYRSSGDGWEKDLSVAVAQLQVGTLSFFRRLHKNHEKSIQSSEAWGLWQNCQIILNRLNTYTSENF